jgi:hypothetical protein
MADKTAICNMALSHLGVSDEINNVDTERSAEAAACRRFFTQCVDEVMRDFNYPFATVYASLGLIESEPNDDWDYSYQYPSDCSRLLKILSGVRNDSRQSRVPYSLANGDTGKIIYTDQVNAVAKYTKIITDVSIFPPDVVSTLSLLLSSYIAPRITSGDPFKLGERAFRLYMMRKATAEANAFNEQQDDEDVDSEFIRSRE